MIPRAKANETDSTVPQIFISYRRGSSGYVAGLLSDRLQQAFGRESVFIDIDTIPLGVDFRTHISAAVARCDILLALIGDNWLGQTQGSSDRRIDDPTDFVRIEIEAALARDIPVVPVLIESASIPRPNTLPEALQPLVYRNAAELRPGRDLNAQVDSLARGLRTHFERARAVALESADADVKATAVKDSIFAAPAIVIRPQTNVRVTRTWSAAQLFRSIAVFYEGKRVGRVPNGESIEIPVSPGTVSIDLKFGRHRLSRSLLIPEGETRTVACSIGSTGEIITDEGDS